MKNSKAVLYPAPEVPSLWSQPAISGEMLDAHALGAKILDAGSPYAGLRGLPTLPSEEELIEQSSLLSVRPELKKRSYAGEIALAEFSHYVTQTYYFEVLGFQIIGSAAASTSSFSHIHDLGAQAMDEARHIQVYLGVLQNLPYPSRAAPCIPKMFRSIVEEGSFEEKLVKGFLVLEGMAIGLFAARARVYPNCGLSKLDQIILKEETQHQSRAKEFASLFLREERMSYRNVIEIMREGARELAFDMLPFKVIEKYGIDLGKTELEKLNTTGLTGLQTAVSRSNLKKVLSDLRLVAREDHQKVCRYA